MQVKPVDRYPQPKVPTRTIVDQHPELLRLLPKRWQQNAVVMGALAACVALSGCAKKASHAPSRVAPVFVHGDGRGSLGCQAVNPPVFLSETEAATVIREEAKRAGIMFDKNEVVPYVDTAVTKTQSSSENYGVRTRPITLDGFGQKRRVGFEFVSRADFDGWVGFEWNKSTVTRYDILAAARTLRSGLVDAEPAGAYAVFYDPCIGWQDARGKNYEPDWGNPKGIRAELARVEASAKGIAREHLRAQVKDFIAWLKIQGVI